MLRASYNPEADAFYVRFAPEGVPIESTQEVAASVMLDADGEVVGIEVLSVSRRGRQAPKPAAAE